MTPVPASRPYRGKRLFDLAVLAGVARRESSAQVREHLAGVDELELDSARREPLLEASRSLDIAGRGLIGRGRGDEGYDEEKGSE